MNLGTLDGDLGCFPFDQWSFAPIVLLPCSHLWYSEFDRGSDLSICRFFQCSTPKGNTRRKPESSFGENQLLPGSISFSLQPTSHPRMLHNPPVRTSIHISMNFILLMGSSPGFGSDTYDKPRRTWQARYSHSLSLWLRRISP